MRKILAACVTACLAVAGTNALAAEENDAVDNFFAGLGSFNASVAGTTDYTFRGISQTDEDPAVQGSFGWSKDFNVSKDHTIGVYASAWASNVDFNDGDNAHIEIDYTGGLTTTLMGITLDAFAIYYTYPGATSSLDYDYVEAGFSAGYDFGVASVGGQFYWSPDFFGGIGDAYYVAGNVDVPLPFKLTASGHVGHSMFNDDSSTDYTDWSLSLTRNILGFDLSVAYIDTDFDECNDICDARGVFTISRSF